MKKQQAFTLQPVTWAVSILILMLSPHIVTASTGAMVNALTETPVPSPELAPADVVRIQVEALKNNSPLDEGIELTYRFASPANKQVTGPLTRFTTMVHATPYDRLLNHQHASYEPLALAGDTAHQLVNITDSLGEEIAYHWVLVRQSQGEYKDCWMTDSVIPTTRPAQRIMTNQRLWKSSPWRYAAAREIFPEVAHAR